MNEDVTLGGAVLPGGLSERQVRLHVHCVRLGEIGRMLCDPAFVADADALRDERSRIVQALVEYLRDREASIASEMVAPWQDRHVLGSHAVAPVTEGRGAVSAALAAPPSRYFTHPRTVAAFPLPGPSDLVRVTRPLGPSGGFREHIKMAIPVESFPALNFMGLLLGPRGHTLRKIEAEAKGVRIAIRGRGTLRDGAATARAPSAAAAVEASNREEDMHAVVYYDSPDAADRAVRIMSRIIATAANTPEESNELKRTQLRELAVLNGTIRPDELIVCSSCGETGHRRFECTSGRRPAAPAIVCGVCGARGHLSSDCTQRDDPNVRAARTERLESAYADLMADLGGDL